MRMQRPLVAVSAALVTLGAVALPASVSVAGSVPPRQEQTIGGIGLRLAEAPVTARDDPRAQVYIVDHLAPGTVIERRIEVSNTTAVSQHVVLYAAAATIDNGSFLGAAGDTPNELSTWTSISPGATDIAADGELTATVTIAVPADAAPGEQYGVVWAEARSGSDVGGGVVQVSRVGIRLYVSVGPGGAPAADFTIDSLTAGRSPAGLPTISAAVHNTGGRALDMTGTLQLSGGPGGLNAGPFTADLGNTLAIGDTQPVSITLDDSLPAGPWNASITLESGLTKRTVDATVTFPDAGFAAAVATRTRQSERPWILAAVGGGVGLLLAIAAVVVVVLRRRRRRRGSAHRPAWPAPLSPVRTA